MGECQWVAVGCRVNGGERTYEQPGQEKGLAPVWRSMCRFACSDFAKTRSHLGKFGRKMRMRGDEVRSGWAKAQAYSGHLVGVGAITLEEVFSR